MYIDTCITMLCLWVEGRKTCLNGFHNFIRDIDFLNHWPDLEKHFSVEKYSIGHLHFSGSLCFGGFYCGNCHLFVNSFGSGQKRETVS